MIICDHSLLLHPVAALMGHPCYTVKQSHCLKCVPTYLRLITISRPIGPFHNPASATQLV